MSTPKKKAVVLKLERFCEMNGRGRDGAVIKIPLELTAVDFKRLRKAFGGSGIYAVSVRT